MVVNTRDRNIDSSRREDSRKGQIDRCEIINVRPHVNPYPQDEDFNTVDVQLVDRPMQDDGTFATIERIKINCMQRDHGLFQGNPWNPRIGDLVLIYWISEKEAMVLCTINSVDQEPICRSLATAEHQEFVFKLCPWEPPIQCADTKNFIIFPPPKHPVCFKWWPVNSDGSLCIDTIQIWDCLEGHNRASCDALSPCNGLDDHQSSTCFKSFSQFSPTSMDRPRRFKFLHHCGSYWYFDDDAVWRIAGKLSGQELGHVHHYTNGKIEISSPVEIILKAPKITLDADLTEETKDNKVDGTCNHCPCSCSSGTCSGSSTGTGSQQTIAHGLIDEVGDPCVPGGVSVFCTGSGGSCALDYCDDTNIYVTCTINVTFSWRVSR